MDSAVLCFSLSSASHSPQALGVSFNTPNVGERSQWQSKLDFVAPRASLTVLFSLWAEVEEEHLHLGNDGNPKHMELGFLTHRDCTGRVTEIQTKPYSSGVHTQLPREQKFSHSPVLPCFWVIFPANYFLWVWLGSMTHLINHFKVSKILEIVKGQSIISITRGAEIQKADLDLWLSFLCQSWGLNIQFSLVCR